MPAKSFGAKLLSVFFIILNTVVAAEFFAAVLYYVEADTVFYFDRTDKKAGPTDNKTNDFDTRFGLPGLRLHPLLGYVSWSGIPGYNNAGFFSPVDYPFPSGQNDYVVGVFGGSVAFNFFQYNAGRKVVEKALSKNVPALRNKNIVVLNFAKEGYKFPQQMNTLTHFLLEGQKYDLVINIEGFNEVSGAWSNAKRGVGLGMPSTDLLFSLSGLTTVDTISESAINALRGRRLQTDGRQCGFALCWVLYDKYGKWLVAQGQKDNANAGGYDPARNLLFLPTSAPLNANPEIPKFSKNFVMAWERSAVMMNAATSAAGISYLQVLQPNQYFQTNKKFTKEERDIAILPRSEYAKVIPVAYRDILKRIPSLFLSGVNVKDATRVFDTYDGPVYRDNCCHFNLEGERIFAEFVATKAVEALQKFED